MPLTHGWSYFLAPFLALAMVGGLALVLKWTFNDIDEPDDLDEYDTAPGTIEGSATGDLIGAEPIVPERVSPAALAHASTDLPDDLPEAVPDDGDDFGLLRVATVADSFEAARAATALLAEAGIRATTATGSDGQLRVLVFDADLFRARRVVGWPA